MSAHTALRCLRHVDKPRLVWVDAICIDQTNIPEEWRLPVCRCLKSCSICCQHFKHSTSCLSVQQTKFHPRVHRIGKGDVLECENCAECVFSNKRRFWSFYGGLYHDYVNTSYYQKPDLAILFHSGRAESAVKDWAPTTRFLVDSGTLTLCTTWTKREAREEEIELDQLGARFVTRPENHKWRSLVPIANFLESANNEAYYVNYYQYIFQGKLGTV